MNTQTHMKATQQHALVIGGSMAGLLAARVLADHYTQVTIVDRDIFPEQPEHRKGVPQSHHAHALLPRGRMIIEQLFPGIIEALKADGALYDFTGAGIVIVSPAGTLPAMQGSGEFLAFSRFLLEWHVRDRLATRPNIRLISNHDVTELLTNADHSRVTGVQVRERGPQGQIESLAADLVVDASGRNSKTPEWLTRLGYAKTPEEVINSGLGYASRFYEKPANFPTEWMNLIVNGRAPHNPRAGLILAIENNRWHVTLGGVAGLHPETDEESFLQFARELADPSIYEALRIAKPVSPIRAYRTPENRLRHFEKLERWPTGFIVTGDAVCAFNPIYGQGMTVSALDALTLQDCLQEQQQISHTNFEQHFQRQLAKTVAAPWLIASGEDLRWSGVHMQGAHVPLTLGLQHRYLDLVLQAATTDMQLSMLYQAVIGMLAPPEALAQPRIITHVLWSTIKRNLGRATRQNTTALSTEALAYLRALPRYQATGSLSL